MEEPPLIFAIVLPVALAVIMVTLGMSLTLDDFRRIGRQPRGVLIGLLNLLLISPLLAFGVAELFGLAAVFAVGLVLLGASPGGTLANMLTHLARGDLALSVTMTAVSSVAAVFTVPLYLELAVAHFDADLAGDPSMLGIVAKVFLITVLPLSLGMWLHARWTERVEALHGRMKTIAMAAFVAVVVAAVASEFGEMKDNIAELALATLALNVLAMSVSFSIARVARLDSRQATAIAMELGIHNSTVAIAVAATISTELAIPAAVYSGFMFVTAGAFAWAMARRNAAVPAT